MTAIRRACANGRASRAEVTGIVRTTNIPSITGGRARFDRKGDLFGGGKFTVFKITNGKYAVA
jgi:hypothetical protein